jgi:hypothetical protein
VAGTEQVVLGDLVYCKENPSEKVTGIAGPECDVDCGDSYDTNNEDEVSGDIHEKINSYVKVSFLIFANDGGLSLNQVIALEVCPFVMTYLSGKLLSIVCLICRHRDTSMHILLVIYIFSHFIYCYYIDNLSSKMKV